MFLIHTLSADGIQNLPDGKYLFAVGHSGRVRFASAEGRSGFASTHALLFPGETVLAAGHFTVAGSGEGGSSAEKRISAIDMYSEHFFYACHDKKFRKDVEKNSDRYFRRIGHFIKALRRFRVPFLGATVRKL